MSASFAVSYSKYYSFILDRLHKHRDQFNVSLKAEAVENRYSGLYCLLRLAQRPFPQEIEEVVSKFLSFI